VKLKKREQWIAIALLMVLAVPRLGSSLSQFLWAESRRLQVGISAAEETVERYQGKLIEAKRAQLLVDQIVPRCLPDDESRAISMYQNWLYEAADHAGMTATIVAPEPSEISTAGLKLMRARLRATGPLQAVARFMDAVNERQPLQRILECRLTPRNKTANTVFEVSLWLEMFASENSELQQGPLPPTIERTSTPAETREMSLLTSMFHPYTPPPKPHPIPQPTVVDRTTPPPTVARPVARPVRPPVALIGTVIRGNRHEAIFYDRSSRQTLYLTKGKKLQYSDGFDAEILGISTTAVLLKINHSATNASIVEMYLAQLLTDLD
jgi:hypothetical protein